MGRIQRETNVRFVPSAVGVGWDNVTEIVVRPDRLILHAGSEVSTIQFVEIARWYRHGWIYRSLARLGGPVWGAAFVADRDWFHAPSGRFFRFYTDPPLKVFMPDEPVGTPYHESLFLQIQQVIAAGGFATLDLG